MPGQPVSEECRDPQCGRRSQRQDVEPGLLDRALAAIALLQVEGMLEIHGGRDAGLRTGNWDYAITADFTNEDAYRRYDLDEEHNRIRRELFGPASAEIVRLQFQV